MKFGAKTGIFYRDEIESPFFAHFLKDKPDPKLPGVEPIAMQGVPGFEAYTWWGIFAPANMSPECWRKSWSDGKSLARFAARGRS